MRPRPVERTCGEASGTPGEVETHLRPDPTASSSSTRARCGCSRRRRCSGCAGYGSWALAYLAFPSAEHSRFSHALGALAIGKAARLTNFACTRRARLIPSAHSAHNGGCCAPGLLLHDLGHGPFLARLRGGSRRAARTPHRGDPRAARDAPMRSLPSTSTRRRCWA